MAMESEYYTEPDDGSPLSEDELMLNFHVVKPQHPYEEESLVVFRVQRRLLASEESSKTVVPLLLSSTNIPQFFHDCPGFIDAVSECVGSLPRDTHCVHVYNVVLDIAEIREFHWVFYFTSEELSSRDEAIYRLSLAYLDLELKKVELEDPSDCAICLQELQAGTEAALLPCSHVYHLGCILAWFLCGDNCPLCRFRVVHWNLNSWYMDCPQLLDRIGWFSIE
ncbi:uncharacterized protein LOC121249320 [Juglans microcarpa x Juglans regia]|uniref:uncharacterized protein LOC121249320 n=1 Tax=Juglans microcarpa x Juglans regia TaxID=2249226 RepID=UPI001B7F2E89|nr:uncharacterized protein LOC121249320 [Juglans microcarpa x Juglans regia]